MLKIRTGGATAVVLAAVSYAHAQDAVQWQVEDGGNGHWYAGVTASKYLNSAAAQQLAVARGGQLASLSTWAENDWVTWNVAQADDLWSGENGPGDFVTGPLIGGVRDANGEWAWIDGSPWADADWFPGNPDTPLAIAAGILLWERDRPDSGWQDYDIPGQLLTGSFLVEWSADCNGDGIVDYGQILDGTYTDEDGNGVPDCCDAGVPCECPADLNDDGVVGPPDLGILLALWSTDGMPNGADINGDKTVNAADLGLLIGAWGDCG